MKFNREQQTAIDASPATDVLISAGAGSGKTKTLSEKVYQLIVSGAVRPSSLLVVTFTEKAAFEMKEKILARFGKDPAAQGLAEEMLSAHIQTFDSFANYLVRKYAADLKVADSITIINEEILDVKEREFLDAILDSYYAAEDSRILRLLSTIAVVDDEPLKKILLNMEAKLSQMPPERRKAFFSDYDSTFLSQSFFKKAEVTQIALVKQALKENLARAVFVLNHPDTDLKILFPVLSQSDPFLDYSAGHYANPVLQDLYTQLVNLLLKDGDEFRSDYLALASKEVYTDYRKLSPTIKSASEEEKASAKYLLRALKTGADKTHSMSPNLSSFFDDYDDFSSQYKQLLSSQENIALLFEILGRLETSVATYKAITNSYTFQDISLLALSLFTDPQYERQAREIQNRFSYILVDEYQDTNDLQEVFLTALSERATLFVVGDAKQSIYGFRNANCQLFLNRKDSYQKANDPSHQLVIEMNKNYRSVPKLIQDINHVFSSYMRKDHGGIVYSGKEMLDYDTETKLYDAPIAANPRGEYGLNRIPYDVMAKEAHGDPVREEALAIISDILTKMQNHYQIIDPSTLRLRNCRFSDFAILIRKKRNFGPYQELFTQYGIPVNDELDDQLSDNSAIRVLESLVSLIASYLNPDTLYNRHHLFASIARSYVYGPEHGYDDQKVYEILTGPDFEKNALFTEVKDFCRQNRDKSFTTIFLNLLSHFRIISELSRVGNVSANIAKIESFYQLLSSQEQIGEGLDAFVTLILHLSQYDIALTTSTVMESDDAVELTTIHKSKGLEYPIVYLPVSDNCLSDSGNRDSADYTFSREYGILLPSYQEGAPVTTFLTALAEETDQSDKDDIDEHVRLFYVAVTRAKESVYLVGNDNGKKENLYAMLAGTPHYLQINKSLLEPYRKSGILSQALLTSADTLRQEYLCSQQDMKQLESLPHSSLRCDLLNDLIIEPLKLEMDENDMAIKEAIFKEYLKRIEQNATDATAAFEAIFFAQIPALPLSQLVTEQQDALIRMKAPTNGNELRGYIAESMKHFVSLDATFFHLRTRKIDAEDPLQPFVIAYFEILKTALDNKTTPFLETVYPDFPSRPFTNVIPEPLTKKAFTDLALTEDDTVLSFEKKAHWRASEDSVGTDTDHIAQIKDLGIHYHRLLELTDFHTKDTSFIQNPHDKGIIDKVLALPVFQHLEDAQIYHEYGYFDPVLRSTGFIDCLLVRPKNIVIIDYKLKNIAEDAYTRQLSCYAANVSRLFPGRSISCYLVSLLEASQEQREIEKEHSKSVS
jgi:ATP-dependent helicase/nuclease subunit A